MITFQKVGFQTLLTIGQGRMGPRRSGKARLEEPGENIPEMANGEKSSISTSKSSFYYEEELNV